MQQRPQVRQQRPQVPRLTRWLRLLVRLLVLRCCLVEAARRMPRMRRAKRLGRQVGQRQHRRMQQVPPWIVVVDQRRRWERLQLRRLVVRVRVSRRHSMRRARQPVRLWLLMVDRRLRQLVQLVRQPRARERRWILQLRSRVRLLELRWCTLEAASRML